MWELDHKESWVPKNWCFWTVVLEKTFESPLDCKEIKPVNPKGNQSWIFIGRTNAEAETPVLWPLMQRTDSLEKTLMLSKIEDRRRGWQRMRWFDGITNSMDMRLGKLRELDGQGGLACCDSWGRKESDTTEWLNWTELTGFISWQSKGLSKVFSNTTVQKHQFFSAQPFLWSNSHTHTWLLEKP